MNINTWKGTIATNADESNKNVFLKKFVIYSNESSKQEFYVNIGVEKLSESIIGERVTYIIWGIVKFIYWLLIRETVKQLLSPEVDIGVGF